MNIEKLANDFFARVGNGPGVCCTGKISMEPYQAWIYYKL